MNWEGKKVLVTGAAGFIGSHLVERLVREGAEVRAFLRYNSRNDSGLLSLLGEEELGAVQKCFGDLKDPEAVRKSVEGCDVVLHLGALVAIPYSYANPLDFVQTNVLGTTHVLNACLQHGTPRVVLTSTSEVYGTARYVPIDEDHPLQAQSPYSASKVGADALGRSYFSAFGLPVSLIRPFNTYGPRQSLRPIIPTIISQLLGGPEVRLGNLDTTRDFTYIDDTVEGFLRMAACDGALGEIVNIGAGKEISVGELARRIAAIMGKSMKLVLEEKRLRPETSEVFRLCADAGKAKRLLGWEPAVSLEEGLRRTISWMGSRPGGWRFHEYVV